jgi:hypothetical protein
VSIARAAYEVVTGRASQDGKEQPHQDEEAGEAGTCTEHAVDPSPGAVGASRVEPLSDHEAHGLAEGRTEDQQADGRRQRQLGS